MKVKGCKGCMFADWNIRFDIWECNHPYNEYTPPKYDKNSEELNFANCPLKKQKLIIELETDETIR